MTVYWYEVKKLLSSLAVWGFIAVCLLFNLFLVLCNAGEDYGDFVSTVSRDAGYHLGESFDDALSQYPVSGHQTTLLQQLQSDTYQVTDVFDGYQTQEIAQRYIAASGITGPFAAGMEAKYDALQAVVDEKAATDDSLSLYFAGATNVRHEFLFHDLFGWLLVEGALISSLLVFLCVGYENDQKTGDIVYSTKKGRTILGTKLAGSISAGFGLFALLALFTFLVYFSTHDYGGIWSSSVSSVFHYRYDIAAGFRPFVTWHHFSVFTYFMAMLAMGLGLILCFCLMAFAIGVLTRNHYIGFLIFLVLNGAIIALPMNIPQALTVGLCARFGAMLTPMWLWLKHSIWFTDGDLDILWPHFETFGLCVSLILLGACCIAAAAYFKRRDLV